jgi:protein-tyrosine phosphatase
MRAGCFFFLGNRSRDDFHGMREVLFICTGNYYRSRFAEAVFNHAVRHDGLPWAAFSRGLAIHLVDGDLSVHTELALRQKDISLGHTARSREALTETDLQRAHHAVALKRDEHFAMMSAQFPEWAERITYWTVHDIDQTEPALALAEIEGLVAGLLRELREQ